MSMRTLVLVMGVVFAALLLGAACESPPAAAPVGPSAALTGQNRCTQSGDYSYCGSAINKYTPCCRKHDDCEKECGGDTGCHHGNHGKCDACFTGVDQCGGNGDCGERCSYNDKYKCK